MCADCSLCCTVLRVGELHKLGGVDCVHQNVSGPGCAIHSSRPGICRGYRCLWLRGGLKETDRPDKLGALLDVVQEGPVVRLEIRQDRPDRFASSQRLTEIADQYRDLMPVRITDVEQVMDGDHPYRVLLAGGVEHRVRGEWTEIHRPGQDPERHRLRWVERWGRRAILGLRRLWLRRAHSAGPRPAGRRGSRRLRGSGRSNPKSR